MNPYFTVEATVKAPEERLRAALADRYRIERELGQGGMATVYRAVPPGDPARGQAVPSALPAARRELAAAVDELTPPFSVRVTTGVRLDALTDDPEIARLYRLLYQSDTPEYLRAVPLHTRDAARSQD